MANGLWPGRVVQLMMKAMTASARAHLRTENRRQLIQVIGRGVSRFQDASYAFDDVAAEILALNRADLPCMTMLLFNGRRSRASANSVTVVSTSIAADPRCFAISFRYDAGDARS
jgi:hypothetical protein